MREHWFGSCGEVETEISSEEEEEGWDKMERRRRNRDRRKRQKERNRRIQEDVTEKARRMVGLGPITEEDIKEQMTAAKDYRTAKVWEIKKHLADNYEYNQEELNRLNIVETKRSLKGDDIVYLAMTDKADIRDIYACKAECCNDDTTVKMFIPPQYYERFMELNRLCADRRNQEGNLKTQLRFGENDLKVLTKVKGEDAPYHVVSLHEFAEGDQLSTQKLNGNGRKIGLR